MRISSLLSSLHPSHVLTRSTCICNKLCDLHMMSQWPFCSRAYWVVFMAQPLQNLTQCKSYHSLNLITPSCVINARMRLTRSSLIVSVMSAAC